MARQLGRLLSCDHGLLHGGSNCSTATIDTYGAAAIALTCCAAVTGCATVAEVRKRGDEFWKEFEFYLSDMLVGKWLWVSPSE